MFWDKKKELEVYRGRFFGRIIAEDKHGQVRLADIEEVREVDKKLNLILDHLNLEYVPETEKKEPAKLVEKKPVSFGVDWGKMLAEYTAYNYITGECPDKKQEPKKKKRGRPKKK